jgi:diguanylate cyclase (GGDEF)-like protein
MLSRVWLLLFPVLVTAGAALLAPRVDGLPAVFAGLRSWAPPLLILLAGTLAVAFNRGRALFATACLAAVFVAYRLVVVGGLEGFAARTVYASVCILAPLDLLVLTVLRERGIFNHYGIRRGGTIALQILLTIWVVNEEMAAVTEFAYLPLFQTAALPGSPIPQLGQLLLLVGVALGGVMAIVKRSAVDAGMAGAIASLGVACDSVANPHAFQIMLGAAAMIMTIAIVQATYRMAFRDELTGLPSRRAFNERLLALGHRYSIAFVDVDHFKRVNDAHGHDLGDQVLKLVAAILERVGGGGRAYRYGGEEFTVVFPGKALGDAVPHLEALRREVEAYRMTIRAPDRPRERDGRARKPSDQQAHTLSVTVSIGVAERNERNGTTDAVLQAADKALYRAKNKGRNQTCW